MLAQLLAGKPLAGLCFDLDGTLLDSVPDLAVAVDNTLVERGLAAAGEGRVRDWVGNGAAMLLRRAMAYAKAVEVSGLAEAEVGEALETFFGHYRRGLSEHSRLYPGVAEALQHWHEQGIAMACVTNKHEQFTRPLLQRFGLAECLPVVVAGDTLATKKPAPEPLLYACQQLRVSVSQTIMVGDSVNDIEAARAAEMPVVCVNYGYNHGQPIALAGPDCVVSSLTELLAD